MEIEKNKDNNSEEFQRYVHEEAVKFRNQKRKDWLEGKIPKEDFWLVKRMEEIFPND